MASFTLHLWSLRVLPLVHYHDHSRTPSFPLSPLSTFLSCARAFSSPFLLLMSDVYIVQEGELRVRATRDGRSVILPPGRHSNFPGPSSLALPPLFSFTFNLSR